MSEEAIYKLHRYPSGELEEFEYVQKLVRCKECKYWSGCKSTMHNNHLCSRAENVDYWTRADDFCNYGEREDE